MALGNRKQKRVNAARKYILEELDRGHDDVPALLSELQRKGNFVARSTLYAWIREEKARSAADTSEPWSLATDDTSRPDLVLAVLGGIFHASNYRRRSLTQSEARWVVRIATAAPAILVNEQGPWLTYRLARSYLRAGDDAAELRRLDLYLANAFVSEKWRPATSEKED